MAGTVTQTHTARGPIGVVELTCTGDAADGSIPSTALATKISGRIVAIETNPGSPAPTTLYDVALTDAASYDVLQALGVNRSATATERVSIVYSGTSVHPEVATSDVLTLAITNQSVNAAVTVVRVYYEGVGEGGQ